MPLPRLPLNQSDENASAVQIKDFDDLPSSKHRANIFQSDTGSHAPTIGISPLHAEAAPSLVYRQRIYSHQEFLSLCMSFAKDSWSEFSAKSPFAKASLRDELNRFFESRCKMMDKRSQHFSESVARPFSLLDPR